MSSPFIGIGIDVSKSRLDVAVRPQGYFFSVANNEAGIQDLLQRFETLQPQLVGLEASGGMNSSWWPPGPRKTGR